MVVFTSLTVPVDSYTKRGEVQLRWQFQWIRKQLILICSSLGIKDSCEDIERLVVLTSLWSRRASYRFIFKYFTSLTRMLWMMVFWIDPWLLDKGERKNKSPKPLNKNDRPSRLPEFHRQWPRKSDIQCVTIRCNNCPQMNFRTIRLFLPFLRTYSGIGLSGDDPVI